MVRRLLISVLTPLSLLTLAACGGSGPTDPNALVMLDVQVTLPSGVGDGATTISTAYGATPLTGAAGKAVVSGAGAALASVRAGGRALLFGFVSADRPTLNVHTTAEALAFYALHAQFLEPVMQDGLLDYLSWSPLVDPVVAAVEAALAASSPDVSAGEPGIAKALDDMLAAYATTRLGAANLTISPDTEASGIYVRETAPLEDRIVVYNGFRRPVFVFVDRVSPSVGVVTSFALDGAEVEKPETATAFQAFTGFAQGEVPRSAIGSDEVDLPGQEGQTTLYTVTVVGAGGDALSSALPTQVVETAKELALRTAIERFLAPTIASALEPGAKQRTAAELGPVLAGLSNDTVKQLESGDFAAGIDAAFRELFGPAALPRTVDRVLELYYPGLKAKDGLQNLRERLTENLDALLGGAARNVSTSGNGVLGTVLRSKRAEKFTVISKPVSIRLTPAESTIGHGGQVRLTAAIHLPEGTDAATISYRYSIEGAQAGYADDNGTDKAFPFTTTSLNITYKHRETINIVYGTDTVTVEAVQVQAGGPAVVAKASATVTVKESTITLSPTNAELDFGEEQTFTATVDPMPATGTLNYVFSTYGDSTFMGGSKTSTGPSNSVVFMQASREAGATQPVWLTVVVGEGDTATVLGQAEAAVTSSGLSGYVIAGDESGSAGFTVDDGLIISLNGEVVYDDGSSLSGTRPPVALRTKVGDVIKFEVRDTYGHCSGLSPLYLVKGGRSALADPGFDLGCGRPSGDQGIVHTHTFTVPF